MNAPQSAFDEWGRPSPYRPPVTRAERRRELACDINRLKSLPPATMNTEIVARWRRAEADASHSAEK